MAATDATIRGKATDDASRSTVRVGLSERIRFQDAEWLAVPDAPGVYVIHDLDEVVYVGMAGRNGRGSLEAIS